MIRLIWKEYRERRLWILALFTSVAGVVLIGHGYTFVGAWDAFSPWTILSGVVAFLFGAGSYSSEIAKRTADFLYSRHVSWKRILLAKVVVGLSAIALTLIVSALMYRLMCPEPLVRFATPERLGLGIGYAAFFVGLFYLMGFMCSTALPGVFGGTLVYFALYAIFGVRTAIAAFNHGTFAMETIAWLVGPVVAAIVTARFGVTLPTSTRVARYALVTGGVIFCLAAVNALAGFDSYYKSRTLDFVSLSPDGRYSIAQWKFSVVNTERQSNVYLVRMADGQKVGITRDKDGWNSVRQWLWLNSNGVAFYSDDRNTVQFARVKSDRNSGFQQTVDKKSVPVDYYGPLMIPSPDGRFIVMAANMSHQASPLAPGAYIPANKALEYSYHGGPTPTPETTLRVLDTITGNTLIETIRYVDDFWWQSDTEIGYTDAQGKRHIVEIPR